MDRSSKFVDAGLHTAGPLVILRARMSRPYLGAASACLALVLLCGCTSVEYYWQGMRGQLDLLERAQPIPDVLATHDRSGAQAQARARARHSRLREPRARASRQRQLSRATPTSDRRFVLWNVFATPAAVARAAPMVLSGRRLRQLSRLLRRGRGARARRRSSARPATTSTSAACRRTRRSAISTIRCCRRSSAIPIPRSRG